MATEIRCNVTNCYYNKDVFCNAERNIWDTIVKLFKRQGVR